eukprot:g16765.t1
MCFLKFCHFPQKSPFLFVTQPAHVGNVSWVVVPERVMYDDRKSGYQKKLPSAAVVRSSIHLHDIPSSCPPFAKSAKLLSKFPYHHSSPRVMYSSFRALPLFSPDIATPPKDTFRASTWPSERAQHEDRHGMARQSNPHPNEDPKELITYLLSARDGRTTYHIPKSMDHITQVQTSLDNPSKQAEPIARNLAGLNVQNEGRKHQEADLQQEETPVSAPSSSSSAPAAAAPPFLILPPLPPHTPLGSCLHPAGLTTTTNLANTPIAAANTRSTACLASAPFPFLPLLSPFARGAFLRLEAKIHQLKEMNRKYQTQLHETHAKVEAMQAKLLAVSSNSMLSRTTNFGTPASPVISTKSFVAQPSDPSNKSFNISCPSRLSEPSFNKCPKPSSSLYSAFVSSQSSLPSCATSIIHQECLPPSVSPSTMELSSSGSSLWLPGSSCLHRSPHGSSSDPSPFSSSFLSTISSTSQDAFHGDLKIEATSEFRCVFVCGIASVPVAVQITAILANSIAEECSPESTVHKIGSLSGLEERTGDEDKNVCVLANAKADMEQQDDKRKAEFPRGGHVSQVAEKVQICNRLSKYLCAALVLLFPTLLVFLLLTASDPNQGLVGIFAFFSAAWDSLLSCRLPGIDTAISAAYVLHDPFLCSESACFIFDTESDMHCQNEVTAAMCGKEMHRNKALSVLQGFESWLGLLDNPRVNVVLNTLHEQLGLVVGLCEGMVHEQFGVGIALCEGMVRRQLWLKLGV